MAAEKWMVSSRSGNPISVLTTELNNLANLASAISSTIDNDADLDILADFELTVNTASATTADAPIELYIVRSVDGTNFEDAAAASPAVALPKNGFVGSFVCQATTLAQRMIIPMVVIPPEDFKVYVINKSGTTFPASGSVVKALFYGRQIG